MKVESRPWGFFEVLTAGDGYQVKRLTICPGLRLSLQSHNYRDEHWFVASGTGLITTDVESHLAIVGDSIDIPAKETHRAKNLSKEDFVIIEVQTGDRIEEDDIIRYEDDYNRMEKK